MPPPPDHRPHIESAPDPQKKYGDKILHRVEGCDASGLLCVMQSLVNETGRRPRFPGPNPVSLERADFPKLLEQTYYVCEKTDGVRHLLLCCTYKGHNVCALADRTLTFWLLPLRDVPRAMYQGSVLDGEIAFNKIHQSWQFLTFDVVMMSGVPTFSKRFSDRIGVAHKVMAHFRRHPLDPLDLKVKNFQSLATLADAASHVNMARSYFEVDGIILTPQEDEVVFGRHFGMFKFKDGSKHTIDFLVMDVHGTLGVFDNGKHAAVGRLSLAPGQKMPSVGSVVECSSLDKDAWRMELLRTDKSTANDMFTYRKTKLNIDENLRWADLEEAVKSIQEHIQWT